MNELQLPPELLDEIAQHIQGSANIASCCLAASVFRDPCQKRLLSSLHLENSATSRRNFRSYKETAARFTEAPHLALYVTNLTITLRCSDLDTEAAIASIFTCLTRVQKCNVVGTGSRSQWCEIPSKVTTPFAAWLTHLPTGALREMRCGFLHDIPRVIVHNILRTARSFIFIMASVESSPSGTVPASRQVITSRKRELLIIESPQLYTGLAEPEFAPYWGNLGRLSVTANRPFSELCVAATESLEYLTIILFDRIPEDLRPQIGFTRPLSSLKKLHIPLAGESQLQNSQDLTLLWFFVSVLAPILRSPITPVLEQVVISFKPTNFVSDVDENMVYSFTPNATNLLNRLDDMVIQHASLRCVRWAIQLRDQASLRAFSDALKQLLPKMSIQGKLIVNRTE
ncbi:hypothetical protein MIND_00558700 [Mycena indigotica]|uniref:F-box domain-containing protein n=1 Tax=Mycena indigotica TaxID=2126181 RepID=A0A8H6W6H6_9AGAR|nr:uncharacterized protein MIND_00558700 [Mycena indigotica]KAF7307634.1 hypothetical protein MIND_00558700 [Mycena indigotica]